MNRSQCSSHEVFHMVAQRHGVTANGVFLRAFVFCVKKILKARTYDYDYAKFDPQHI